MKKIPCKKCQGTGRIPDPDSTGRELRKRREKAGLARWELANRMNLSQTYVYLLETGRKPWSEKLVDAYLWAVEMSEEKT